MTTIAMGAGMLPIALGLGATEFRPPMAIAVIGGLITSTLLSLLVVPVVFTFVDDLIELTKRLFASRHRQSQLSPLTPPAPQLEHEAAVACHYRGRRWDTT